MIQVIGQGTPRGPTFSQRLSAGLGQAIETGQQLYSQNQQKKAMEQAGFGDLIGLDPDLQKIAVSERLKQQGKQQALSQKQDFLNQLLGGQGQSQGQGMGDMLAQGNQMQPGGQQFDASQIPDEVIASASAVDPNIARSLQHAKDVALREKSSQKGREFEREKFEHKKTTEAEKERTRKFEALKKETEPARKEIADRAELARRGIENKEKLIDIINTGNVDDPSYASFLEALPLNFGKRFLSPETVEYKAGLVQNFSDLKTLFTGATRVKEIEILEGKIPDLYLTDQQKKQILLSSIEGHKADLIKEEAAQEVEAEGKPLSLIQYRKAVDEKARPRINALANRVIDQQKAVIKDAENRKKIPLNMSDPEDVEIATQIMKEAGGDRQKARALAKKKGYTF